MNQIIKPRLQDHWLTASLSARGARILPRLSPWQVLFLWVMALVLSLFGSHNAFASPSQMVLSWGGNAYGQLGDGTTTNRSSAVNITGQGALRNKTVVQLDGSYDHSLALCSDGTVATWGTNTQGELGDGTTARQFFPRDITGKGALMGKKVVQIATSGGHNMALCSDGQLVVWGSNAQGQLGDGTTINRTLPISISDKGILQGKTVTAMATGNLHSLALCSDGTLAAWGLNTFGQLGNGSTTSSPLPVAVNRSGALKSKHITQLSAGSDFNLVLCSDGTAVSWGQNGDGQLGDGTNQNNRLLPINISTQGALNGKTVTQIETGYGFSLALCSDGTLAAWGQNHRGQLGDGTRVSQFLPTDISHSGALNGKTITQMASGDNHVLARCTDNTVLVWGDGSFGELGDGSASTRLRPYDETKRITPVGTTITQLAAGATHSMALATSVGVTPQDPSAITNLATNVTDTSATLNAIINPKGIATTAKFEYGQTIAYGTAAAIAFSPTNGTTEQSVSAVVSGLMPRTTYHFHVTAKNSVGTSIGNDITFTTTATVPSNTKVSIVTWGEDTMGQLGDNDNIDKPLPVNTISSGVLAGKTVIQVAAGSFHSFARCSDGTLAAWGWNRFGELGNNRLSDIVSAPFDITDSGVLNGKTVTQIEAGLHYSLALCSDGTVAAWGNNLYGELGDGTKTNRSIPINITNKGALSGKTVTQIHVSDTTSFALCSDGTLAAWGRNPMVGDGTYTDRVLPLNISTQGALNGKRVVQIAGGLLHTVALCADGTILTWGDNVYGQLGDGTTAAHALPAVINNKGALIGKTVTHIAVGGFVNYAFCSDNTLVAWGRNLNGELGDGTTTQRNAPILFIGKGGLTGKTVTQLSIGNNHTVALCSDGNLAAWGYNIYGAVGDGTTAQRNLPVLITSKGALKDKRVIQIAAGAYHTVALTSSLDPPTNQAPSITITTPTPNQNLSLSDFNGNSISGLATDDAGVTKLEIKLLRIRDGVLQIWDGTNFTTLSRTVPAEVTGTGPNITWKLGQNAPPTSQLDAGEYQVIVYATDAQGLTATAKTNFTLTVPVPPIDSAKPVVTINTPTPNQTLKLTEFLSGTLSGTATDNVGVTSVTVKLYRTRNGINQIWNGTAFTTLSRSVPAQVSGSGTNINWSLGEKVPPPGLLDAGEYQVIVYATDAAGNIGQTRSTFTLEVPPSPTDTERPVVSISAPAAGQNLLTSSIVAGFIRGRASDNVGVLKVDLKLYRSRGGVNQVWNGTSFSTTVATVPTELTGPATDTAWSLGAKTPPEDLLDTGEYQLIAYVTDAAGNTSAARTTFTLAVSGSGS